MACRYIFDQVHDKNTPQHVIYERTSKPLIDGVLDGYNATVFAYGVSGIPT